jgi:hypothetical protein|tara:strand:+ start:398 stop:628 length:231 start_codon:yes stop_codon:yes gene_type:complete
MQNDTVKSPAHYATGDIETIDFIRDRLSKEEMRGFCWANVIKYTSRWTRKDGIQDLKKAKVYIDWMIANEEKGHKL